MNEKRLVAKQVPKALVCGLLEDNGRVLFLVERGPDGKERLALPGRIVFQGENEALAVKECFAKYAGLDVQVHEIKVQGKHNAGSRKNKLWVPALGIKATAKSCTPKTLPPFTGVKWVSLKEASLGKLARTAEWLKPRF